MTGIVVHRGKNRFALVLDYGKIDGRRKQKWVSYRSALIDESGKPTTLTAQKKEARARLTALLHEHNEGTHLEPSKLTVIAYLRAWLEGSVKPLRRPMTYKTYRSLIETHVVGSSIADLPLQRLRNSHLEGFYAAVKLAPSSLGVLHAAMSRAMRRAVKDRLLSANPAFDVDRKRPAKDTSNAQAQLHCWTAHEVRRVLDAAKAAPAQLAAYVTLALDSGARKGELDGLLWTDLDFETGTLTLARQLDSPKLTADGAVAYGPTKTKRRRTITLNAETLTRLRAHRTTQLELKMRNRSTYQDFGLIFAKEDADRRTATDRLGQPLAGLSDGRFQALVNAADVRRIKFHGCRHTVATLLLAIGTPPHVVADRLGHSVLELMKTYAHALPSMQREAAAQLGALLHG